MDKHLANKFLEETSEILGFLATDHSFSLPVLEVDDHIEFATVTFMGKNVALECILDLRENDVTCKCSRVSNEQKTQHYAVDEQGNRVREDIASFLRRRGVRERLFTRLSGPVQHSELIRRTLMDYAIMLKKHGQEILLDSNDLFDG